MTAIELPDLAHVRDRVSPRRHALRAAVAWVRAHAAGLRVLVPLLVVVGAVHAVGMWSWPRWVDDPGTYLSQAWSLRYERALSPYSYIYDHAPAGWIQIAAWAALTGGFERYDSVIAFGNECMLIARLASCALLFGLARRLGLGRTGAAAATLLFGLSPLAVTYGRWTFLDNLVTPWLLAAFLLAASPRRSLAAATGAASAFAMAALTKETALIVLPAFVWALAQHLDRRNRAHVVVVAGFLGVLLMAMYPLYALYKGELLETEGRNSLLGTARWQLVERESSGSLLDPGSPAAGAVRHWLDIDPWLLFAGLAAVPVALLARRLRPAVLVLVIQWLVLVRGGYVPFMHVLNLLPWSALLAAGAVEILAGNRALVAAGPLARWRRREVRPPGRWRRPAVGAVAACLAVAAVVSWAPGLHKMTTTTDEQPLWSATQWLARNVPRDKTLVVHDAIWTDLVHKYGFQPRPVIVYKLDTDPAVRRSLRRVDYLVVPEWYYRSSAGGEKFPTLMEARKHAVTVARFGSGEDAVRVYRVSDHWRPT